MDFNKELLDISDQYNKLIEKRLPGTIPPAFRLMEKRKGGVNLFQKAGRLGMAYVILIAVFASVSLLLINKLDENRLPYNNRFVNAEIFSTDHPGSLVSAFRKATK